MEVLEVYWLLVRAIYSPQPEMEHALRGPSVWYLVGFLQGLCLLSELIVEAYVVCQ